MFEIKDFTEKLADFLGYMAIVLPDDIHGRLLAMSENETEPLAKEIYSAMLQNAEKAKELKRPICQDTGIIQMRVNIGTKFKYIDGLEEALVEAARLASEKTPLRPNAIIPLADKNTGNNIWKGSPAITYELVQGSDKLDIDIYFAGGGSSLPGKALVLMPSRGVQGIEEEVEKAVFERGLNACPPLFVGVGIGSTADIAAKLSKNALLRPVNSQNEDENAANLEKRLFDRLSNMKFGPNGLGGTQSIIGVNVETAARHPATLALGISFGCWVTRRGKFVIDNAGNIETPCHGGYAK